MTEQRVIIEMGMGNDQYGQDYQKAAARAIEDAIRHSSIPMLGALDIDHTEMRVDVTIGARLPFVPLVGSFGSARSSAAFTTTV